MRGLASRSSLALGVLAVTGCTAAPLDAIELAARTLDSGMVAHWTFDEGTGTLAVDHSGNKRDAQITGGTWVTAGQFGGAIHLAEGDFVSATNFPNATARWSVSAWVRLTDTTASTETYKTLISTENMGGWEMNIDRSTAQPGAHFGYWKGPNTGDYYGVQCFCMTFGQWTHIAATVDPDTLTLSLYVAGVLASSQPITSMIAVGSATLYIGKWYDAGRLLVGDVDDVVIYNRVLVPAEIVNLSLSSPPDPR